MCVAITGGIIVRLRAVLTVGVVLCLILALGCEWSDSRAESNTYAPQSKTQALATLAAASGEVPASPFVNVAEKVMPAVVSIDTKRTVESAGMFNEPFGRLFRDLIPDMPRDEFEVPGFASGFIFDKTQSYQWAFVLATSVSIVSCIMVWVAAPRKVRQVGRMGIAGKDQRSRRL